MIFRYAGLEFLSEMAKDGKQKSNNNLNPQEWIWKIIHLNKEEFAIKQKLVIEAFIKLE